MNPVLVNEGNTHHHQNHQRLETDQRQPEPPEVFIQLLGPALTQSGGEVECLTGVCTTGIDDEMGTVTGKERWSERVSERERGWMAGEAKVVCGWVPAGVPRQGLWCARAGRMEKKEARQRALQGPRAIGECGLAGRIENEKSKRE